MRPALPRLLLIADAARAGRVERALSSLPPGSAFVQLRDKALPARGLLALAQDLLPVCRARGMSLVVNDRADVAIAAGAAGVHLPAAGFSPGEARALLGEGGLVGVSCHTEAEVAAAARDGADYCVVGPVGETPGKGPAVGFAALERAVAAAASLPVFALGGMDEGLAPAARRAGAHGAACIRAVLDAPDPAQAAAALLRALGG